MQKTDKSKKLLLSRETVRSLEPKELESVGGATGVPCTILVISISVIVSYAYCTNHGSKPA
jgi:hypothetical protein